MTDITAKATTSTDLVNNPEVCDSSSDNTKISNEVESPVLIKVTAGKPLVWKSKDWLRLKKLRIQGSLIGTPANCPKQVSENGLPLLLLPEEVTLILEKKLGVVCTYKKNIDFPSQSAREKYNEHVLSSKKEQIEYYEEACKDQVEQRIDSIIEGKRRKMISKLKLDDGKMTDEDLGFDRESMIEREVKRKIDVIAKNQLIQIPTASPYLTGEDLESVDWKFPVTEKEKLRYKVFKDLYERGYTLTPGVKFGGDFLAYPGEPVKFHAFFIIICLEYDGEVKFMDLISNARLSVFTRKNLVLASVDEEGTVFYNTISWPTNP